MGDKLTNLKNFFFDSPKKKAIVILSGLTVASVGFVSVYKPVQIKIGDQLIRTFTYTGTVQDVLDKHKLVIDQKDKVVPPLDSKVEKHSMINVKKAQEVVLLVDGKEKKIKTAEDSIGDMLEAEKVVLDGLDRVEPSLETEIERGQNIEVVRVDEEILTDTQDIDFEVTTKKNDKLDKSVKKTVQEGVVGKKEIKTRVVYENGEEVAREIVSETVVEEPTTKIIEEGTRVTFASSSRGPSSSGGSSSSQAPAGKTMTMQSTAYYTGTVTATGTRPRRNPNGLSTVAVDPRVIPLGSKLYIDGYGYAVAEDTGGAVKNNIVDVFLNTRQECINWGRRNVKVTIVAYPGQW